MLKNGRLGDDSPVNAISKNWYKYLVLWFLCAYTYCLGIKKLPIYQSMDITTLAPIIQRLRAIIKEELENIREAKSLALKSGDFEVAAIARDWEKKVMEIEGMVGADG